MPEYRLWTPADASGRPYHPNEEELRERLNQEAREGYALVTIAPTWVWTTEPGWSAIEQKMVEYEVTKTADTYIFCRDTR